MYLSNVSIFNFNEDGDEYCVLKWIYFREVVDVLVFIDCLKIEFVKKDLIDFLEKFE